MRGPFVLSVVAMVCFGAAGLVDKLTMATGLPVPYVMFVRLLPMILFWGVFVCLPGQRPEGGDVPWRPLALAVSSATLAGALGMWSYLTAIRHWDASRVIAISSSYPAFCALAAWLWLGEPMTPEKVAGVAAVTGGIWLLAK